MKFALETPGICRHMVVINAPFSLFSRSTSAQQYGPFLPVCFGSSSLLKAVCLLPLSRQPGFTQQHEPLCLEERPSSVNTWLSLHVHSHLIMGEALRSEWFQYAREAEKGKEISLKQQIYKHKCYSQNLSFYHLGISVAFVKEQHSLEELIYIYICIHVFYE